jgi:glutamate-1-semialdehyde 2,1-aminomutase
MEYLEFKSDPGWNRERKILHYGTFNANPLSAAAGLTTLNILSQGDVIPRANENGNSIREALNEVIGRHGVHWCAHGEHSIVHILMNHRCTREDECDRRRCTYDYRQIYQKDLPLLGLFRSAMVSQGVDSAGDHWWLSWLHSDEIVEKTGKAFEYALTVIKERMPDRF